MTLEWKRAYRAAVESKAPKTAEAIKLGLCYKSVFPIAVLEVGVDSLCSIIVQKGDAKWAFEMLRHVAGLSMWQQAMLNAVMVRYADEWLSYYLFAYYSGRFTSGQCDALCKRVEMTADTDLQRAYKMFTESGPYPLSA